MAGDNAQVWKCARPNCTSSARTFDDATPYHPCPELAGVMTPLIPAGIRADVRAVERGDYVGAELVQADGNGRPIMAVVTERDDGMDCAVLAPTARAEQGV